MSGEIRKIQQSRLTSVRLESNLKGGKQNSDVGKGNLEYGVSITDGTW